MVIVALSKMTHSYSAKDDATTYTVTRSVDTNTNQLLQTYTTGKNNYQKISNNDYNGRACGCFDRA